MYMSYIYSRIYIRQYILLLLLKNNKKIMHIFCLLTNRPDFFEIVEGTSARRTQSGAYLK